MDDLYAFHRKRGIETRYGSGDRFCFADAETAKAFAEEFGSTLVQQDASRA
jgi:hypothetical protein